MDARTDLAVERTMLAWWRTGLAALGVALAVGRLLPEIAEAETTWPYVALGLGFAAYAVGLFVLGVRRSAAAGARTPASVLAMAAAGIVLGAATIALIAAG